MTQAVDDSNERREYTRRRSDWVKLLMPIVVVSLAFCTFMYDKFVEEQAMKAQISQNSIRITKVENNQEAERQKLQEYMLEFKSDMAATKADVAIIKQLLLDKTRN